nr:MAG TPA: Nuclease [Caudoviricetes sp.]
MTIMRESEIEKILVNEVRRLGGRAYKWVSPGNDGVPDRIVIFPGQPPIFTELKTDTGKLSALQNVQIKRLADLGQRIYVIYGINGLSQFFQDFGYDEVSKAIDCKYEL